MPVERLAPDAVLASSNLSGGVADIDEDPDAGDALWMTASGNNVITEVRTSFPTPTAPLVAGVGLQEFRALVRKSVLSGTGTPNARLELWENGVLVAAGPNTAVTSSVGQVFAYTWNASGRTAANIEAKVVGVPSGGAVTVRASVDVGAVEWNATVGIVSAVGVTAVSAASATNRTTADRTMGAAVALSAAIGRAGRLVRSVAATAVPALVRSLARSVSALVSRQVSTGRALPIRVPVVQTVLTKGVRAAGLERSSAASNVIALGLLTRIGVPVPATQGVTVQRATARSITAVSAVVDRVTGAVEVVVAAVQGTAALVARALAVERPVGLRASVLASLRRALPFACMEKWTRAGSGDAGASGAQQLSGGGAASGMEAG